IIDIELCITIDECSHSNEKKDQSNDKKETVKIKQKYELRGKYKDGRDAENKEEEVTVPKNPQKIVTFDYGAADIIKSLGKENSVAGISIGSSTSMLPEELKN